MPNVITVDVADPVHEGLTTFASARGLSVEEGVKWLLGDFVHNNVFPPALSYQSRTPTGGGYAAVSPVPVAAQVVPLQSQADKIGAVSQFLLKQQVTKNPTPCSGCQKPLSFDSIAAGECEDCHTKIV